VLVEAIARDAQVVFGDFAKTDKPKDKPRHSRPEQQLPRLLFQASFAAL
jgi:hypothetical protein